MAITIAARSPTIQIRTAGATTAWSADQIRDLGGMLGRGRVAKSAIYTIVSDDRGKTIDVTSGTFVIDVTSAATLGNGWLCAVMNSGSGVATIDPAGAETIRTPSGTASTLALAQGQSVVLQSDGTNLIVIASTGLSVGPSTPLSVYDSTFSILDNVDPTKIAQFQLSGITTGTTRTFTLPDATTTLAGLGVAQTFTAAQTVQAATGITSLQAATQDAVALVGRAGGSSSRVATITPPTLSGNITITLPAATSALATLALSEVFTNKTLTSPAINTATIIGGTINSASIGATTRSSGAFTTLDANAGVNFTGGSTPAGTAGALGWGNNVLYLGGAGSANIASGSNSGSIFLHGGTANNGGGLNLYGSTHGTSPNSFRFTVAGTSYIVGESSSVAIPLTTASTTTTTGALTVAGGVGISGALNVGGLFQQVDAQTINRNTINTAADNRIAHAIRRGDGTGTFGAIGASANGANGVASVTIHAESAVALTISNTAVTLPSGSSLAMSGASTLTTGTGAIALNGDTTVASTKALRLGNTAVAATPTATHTMTIVDAAGTTYRVLCVV